VSYNASAVKIYSATSSLVHFESKNVFIRLEKTLLPSLVVNLEVLIDSMKVPRLMESVVVIFCFVFLARISDAVPLCFCYKQVATRHHYR
jgi:hypothetical protein